MRGIAAMPAMCASGAASSRAPRCGSGGMSFTRTTTSGQRSPGGGGGGRRVWGGPVGRKCAPHRSAQPGLGLRTALAVRAVMRHESCPLATCRVWLQHCSLAPQTLAAPLSLR